MKNSRNIEGKLNVIGDKIRYYRKLNNISYEKLSNMMMLYGIYIHKQAIYNIEKGIRTVVDYEICAFAKCFRITVNDLIEDYFSKLN